MEQAEPVAQPAKKRQFPEPKQRTQLGPKGARLSVVSRKGNTMKRILLILALAAVGSLAAAQSDTQQVTAVVSAVDTIDVTGSPTLTTGVNAAVTDASSSYAITTNGTGRSITVALDTNMGTGRTLTLTMAAPSGAASSPVVLTSTAQTAVTGVANVSASGLALSYNFVADATAAPGSETKTVTFTIAGI